MAKKTETYTDVEHEQDSDRMMKRINVRSAEWESVEANETQKRLEERKKMRLNAMGLYTLKSAATLLLAFALYKATDAELIASVLAVPASYLCAIYFGWCASKVATLAKKVRGCK